jgi:hypothetical protein
VQYLRNNHGAQSLKSWYTEEQWSVIQFDLDSGDRVSVRDLLKPMDVEYTSRWMLDNPPIDDPEPTYPEVKTTFHLNSDRLVSNSISGYDEYANLFYYDDGQAYNLLSFRNLPNGYWLEKEWQEDYILVIRDTWGQEVKFDIPQHVNELLQIETNVDQFRAEEGIMTAETPNYRIKLNIESVRGTLDGDGEMSELTGFEAQVFVDIRN